MKRTPLSQRSLPDYTLGEEVMNSVTHAAGAVMGIVALVLCILQAAGKGSVYGITASAVYGASLIAVFVISSV